jgi:hypothetical protein
VEKSVAVPTAITKGVVGGIGQMLGLKKKEAPPTAPEAAPVGEGPPPAPAPNAQSAAQAPEPEPAPAAQPAAPERPAAPKQESAPGFGGAFGN